MAASRVCPRAHRYDEIAGGSRADIFDSMLIVRMNEPYPARTQTVAGAVDRKLDRAHE